LNIQKLELFITGVSIMPKSISAKDWDKVNWKELEPKHGSVRASQILNYIPVDGLHLDIGTGRGDGTILISKIKKCIAFDFGIVSTKIAKKKGLEVSQADARFIPFKSKTFKSVTCLDVIEHIPRPERVIKEISRIVQEEGVLIILTPTKEMFKEKLLRFIRKYKIKEQKQPYDSPLKRDEIINLLKKNKFEILSEKKIRNWDPNPLIRMISFSRIFNCRKKSDIE
jgi:ubiquinone/menaquinone biosynthesis C-methylase UbiE